MKINNPFNWGMFLLLVTLNLQAAVISCPTADQIKQVKFIFAYHHERNEQLWYLISQPLTHDLQIWNVSFGTFFYGKYTAAEALQMGTDYFNKAPLKRYQPKPISIPTGIFCDYMPEGSLYFVSAITPPEKISNVKMSVS